MMINTNLRIICLLCLTTMVCHVSSGKAASQVGRDGPVVHNCTVYEGYLAGDIEMWLKGIGEQEERYWVTRNSDDLYVLILSKYGFIGFVIGMKKDYDVKDILSSAENNTEVLAADEKYASCAAAMKGGLMAMKISLNPLKATYLGMKSLRLIEESIEIDSNNPAGWVEMGNARFHMPSVAGGSYKEAIKNFSVAVTLFESDKERTRCNWYYLHTLAWLGLTYENTGNFNEAKKLYEKLLVMEPDFKWVKEELYPALLKKMDS